MASETSNQVRSQQLCSKQVVNSAFRCIILAVILSTSTGLLIRRLICIAISDLLVFIVGVLWLVGDIVPCIAIILVMHDVLIARKKDTDIVLKVRGVSISLLDLIVSISMILYLLDFILFLTCHVGNQQNTCSKLLPNFRILFFHTQVAASILYLTKPWRWTKFDLTEIFNSVRSMADQFAPLQQSEISLTPHQSRPEESLQGGGVQPISEKIKPVLVDTATQTISDSQQPEDGTNQPLLRTDTQPSKFDTVPNLSSANPEPKLGGAVQSIGSRIGPKSSSSRQSAAKSGRGRRSFPARQSTRRRVASRSRAPKRSAIQTVLMSVGRSRRCSKAATSKRHICNVDTQPTRTVNLNLNVN